jgi:NADH dehydrogenase [ubiquinone] 1 alpha subcomplex assembly factor 7
MADALRATQNVKGFHPAIDLHLVEINETLRQMQANAIAAISPGMAPHWHASFGALPDSDTPMLLIANEFFDALPIRQLQRSEHYWRERCIAIDEGSDNLRFKLTPGASPLAILLPIEAPEPKPGDIAEVSPPSLSLMQAIAERIAHNRGAALIVDYARRSPYGATLQAVAQHRMVDPLAEPGAADLSALVDFASLRRVALQAKASVYGPVGQGAFLTALGIELRAQALKAHADENRRMAIDAAQARLIAPRQMGNLFQVLAVTDKQQSIPAGFAL